MLTFCLTFAWSREYLYSSQQTRYTDPMSAEYWCSIHTNIGVSCWLGSRPIIQCNPKRNIRLLKVLLFWLWRKAGPKLLRTLCMAVKNKSVIWEERMNNNIATDKSDLSLQLYWNDGIHRRRIWFFFSFIFFNNITDKSDLSGYLEPTE